MRIHFLGPSLLLALLFSLTLQAQPTLSTAGWSFHAGVGAVPTFVKGPRTVNVLPVSARLDFRLQPHWSLSLYAGYSATTSTRDLSHDGIYLPLRNDYFIGGLRSAFHKRIHARLEAYGGAMLAYNRPVISQAGSDAPVVIPRGKPHYYRLPEPRFFLSGFVGGNYALTNHFGVFGELGFGVSLVQLGVRMQL